MYTKILTLLKRFFNHDSIILKNCIAFSLLLSLFPFIILSTLLLQYFALDITSLNFDWLIPPIILDDLTHAASLVKNYSTFSHICFIIITYYGAVRSFYAIIKAFNHSYTNLQAMIQAILAPISLMLFLIFIISFNYIIKQVFPIGFIWNKLITLFIYTILACIFFYLTSVPRKKLKDFYMGALCFGIGISFMETFFLFFINNFTRYNILYTSTSYIFILLICLEWISNILYFAHCINEST